MQKDGQSIYSPKTWLQISKAAFKRLKQNDPLVLAGATAFFATFSLTPILIIIIQALGFIFRPEKLRNALFSQLSETMSDETVEQLSNTLKGFHELATTWYMTIIGFIFLIFVSTTVFKVIESSINRLWRLRVVRKRSLIYRIKSRLFSVVIVLAAGVLLVGTLLAEGAQAYVGNQLSTLFPVVSGYLTSIFKYVVSLLVAAIWFAIVFRYLTQARPHWKSVIAGAALTSVLFNIGKIILHYTLQGSNINTLYGASTSLVFLLLFVFYSSFIFYFGAAFTISWSSHFDQPVDHGSEVSFYKIVEQQKSNP